MPSASKTIVLQHPPALNNWWIIAAYRHERCDKCEDHTVIYAIDNFRVSELKTIESRILEKENNVITQDTRPQP